MLFEKELDKVYNKDAPEDDMLERAEEMERMREHVFKESDVDRNNLISFEEFLSETKVRYIQVMRGATQIIFQFFFFALVKM